MCAASQQIDVIPNQGHDGIEAGNLGLMFARAGLPPLFTLAPTALTQVLLDGNCWERDGADDAGPSFPNLVIESRIKRAARPRSRARAGNRHDERPAVNAAGRPNFSSRCGCAR